MPPAGARRVPAAVAARRAGQRCAASTAWCAPSSSCRGRRCPPPRWRSWSCPPGCAGYTPAMLDELTATGEVLWAGAGRPARQGRLGLPVPGRRRAPAAPAAAPAGADGAAPVGAGRAAGGYGLFFRQIADQVRATTHPDATDPQLADAVWDLAWSGRLTNDTLAPLRSLLGSGRTAGSTAHRAKRAVPRGRYGTLTGRGPARLPHRPADRGGPLVAAARRRAGPHPRGPTPWPARSWTGTAW